MEKFFLAFPLSVFLLITCAVARAQAPNICEGPYLFYHGNQVVVRSINETGQAIADSFSISDKTKYPVAVHFSNHPDWNFKVVLRNQINNEPPVSKGAKKIMAISDIEGEFDNFRAILIGNGVMNEKYEWTYGHGELVICGDLFDRGKDVVEELWLLYKLEDEAREKGGYVHTILGNHDIMNMSDDLRYIQQKYFDNAKIMGVDYMELYAADTELGRWLRSKNIIEKIGDNLYLHGGISPGVLAAQWPIEKINTASRPFYDLTMHPEKFTDSTVAMLMGRNELFLVSRIFHGSQSESVNGRQHTDII